VDPLLIPFGFGVGFLVGMTGMGGGSLMTPLLILVFGTAPVTAVGSDITYAAATKTVGGWRHLRLRTVNLGLSFWLAIGSVPAAIAGVWLIEWLHDRYGNDLDDIVLTMLAIALIVVGVVVLVRALFMTKAVNGEREGFELTRRHKIAAVAIGASTGLVIGLTSAGSGTLIAVFLIAYYRLVLWAAAVAHVAAGNVDFGLVGAILIGSLPGVWIGSHVSVKLPSGLLRTALGTVMIAASLALFDKAGVELPLVVVLGVPVALALGLGLRALGRRGRTVRPASSPGKP
jgi:hypothetical protein